MSDIVLTGASRGIGRALALELATRGERLVLVARDRERLESLVTQIEARGGRALAIPCDLSSVRAARELGTRLVDALEPGATLVHNAGLWPAKRELTSEGYETAYAVNCLAPLALQRPLLDARRLRRVLVVSAGLIVRGRFDAERTPHGEDFSAIGTYCNTKLAFAIAMREVASRHPEVDVLVMHPGVVRTDLGARGGVFGWLLDRVKRRWESPEVCAQRLARVLGRDRWSTSGTADWWVEETRAEWPRSAGRPSPGLSLLGEE